MNKTNELKNIKYLLRYAFHFDKKLFVLFGGYTIVSALNPFAGLFLPKFILDEVTGEGDFSRILLYILFFFLCSSVLVFLMSFLKGKYEPRIMRLRLLFIELLNEKVMDMDYENLENPDTLNVVQSSLRAINNNTTGIEGILNHLFNIVGIFLSFLGYISIVFTLNPIILFYLLFSVLLTYILTLKAKKYEHSVRKEVSSLERKKDYFVDVMSNFSYGKEIRLYNISDWLMTKLDNTIHKSIALDKKIKRKYFFVSILSVLLGVIRDGIVYIYLIHCVINSDLSIGNFSLYFTTILGFSGLMSQFLTSIAEIRTQNLYINDYRKLMDIENKTYNENTKQLPTQKPYSIEFKNVSFKYPKAEKYALKNISLKIEAGEKLAIVGLNGSGKTTLIKLLCGLYIPYEGQILLNEIDINSFSKNDYHKIFSVMFQDFKLFAFSILENITLENSKRNFVKVDNILSVSGLKNKVDKLKKGVDTNIYKIFDDDGIDLSGGERQKLALARALYKNGDIIILDEPTASLDPISEAEFYEKYNNLSKNKTSIYISHRLSSTQFCDKIVLLENGEIVEYGTHFELLKKQGKYADLFYMQSQYYEMEGE